MARLLLFPVAAALGAALASPASGQPTASREARVRALEARIAALESRASASTGGAPAAAGPACTRLNVNGSRIPPDGSLTVTVNGTTVATFDGAAYGDLESFMRPGPNTIALAFAAAGPGAEAELRCLPPGVASSRTVVLSLVPNARRLRAETVVVLAPR